MTRPRSGSLAATVGAVAIPCPRCHAEPWMLCTRPNGRPCPHHAARQTAALRAEVTAPVVDVAAWLSDDTDAVGIRDRDGRFYVVDRATYRAVRAAADPSAVPVPSGAVRVPFDPFTAADAAEVTR